MREYRNKLFIFKDVESPLQDSNTPLERGIVYVCRNDARADFKCPCECGAIISLTLAEGTPKWEIIGNTIKPSINRFVGCKSHFTITNGLTH